MEFSNEQINKSELMKIIMEWYADDENAVCGDIFDSALKEEEAVNAIFSYVNIWLPNFDEEEYGLLPKDLSYAESVQREQIRDIVFLFRGEENTEHFNPESSDVKKFMKLVTENICTSES